MSVHKKSDHAVRKAKYQRQTNRTAANKARNIAKMKQLNPNYPNRKENK